MLWLTIACYSGAKLILIDRWYTRTRRAEHQDFSAYIAHHMAEPTDLEAEEHGAIAQRPVIILAEEVEPALPHLLFMSLEQEKRLEACNDA